MLIRIPHGDLVMTADMWESGLSNHLFSPDDGTGYWASDDHYDDNWPVFDNAKPDWADSVVWFNK